MKRFYPSLVLAAILTVLISACSTPKTPAESTLEPQYGTQYDDVGVRVAATPSGQIYVLGSISDYDEDVSLTTFSSTFLKRFDTSGKDIWSRKLDQECFGRDDYCGSRSHNVATDNSGNVYAAYGKFSDGGTNLKLTKYSAAGTQLWKQTVTTSSTPIIDPAVATSSAGETYVAYSKGEFRPGNALLVKYSTSGQILFSKASVIDIPRDAVVAGDGYLYVAGKDEIAKYNAAGTLVWQRTLTSPTGYAGSPEVTVSANTVYVGHGTDPNLQKSDLALYRYTTAGALTWQKTINIPDTGSLEDMTSDPQGNVYFALGTVDGRYIRKLTPAGSSAWTYNPRTPSGVNGLTFANGQVYATGTGVGPVNGKNNGGSDAFLLCLNATPIRFVWER